MVLAARSGNLDVRPILTIASADHFLDFSRRARVIIYKHCLSWVQHPNARFLL
jgi:hypothetical protein